jgi:crotonobetainyl-CoA:carnitine CoA-transferase CaiB-like acyl-CoA transferase
VARVAAGGQAGWGQSANRRAYRAGDGRLITVAAAEPRTWGALCEALERPDLVERLATPPEGQAALADELAAIFASRPAAEWVARLPAEAAVGPVNTVDDLFDDPHVQARGSVVELSGAGAGTRALRSPVRLRHRDGSEEPFAAGPPPGPGEHTDAALAAAGFAPDEIAALHDDGVV